MAFSKVNYLYHFGFTLLEVFFSILLLCLISYIGFIGQSPRVQLDKAEILLNAMGNMTASFRSYYRVQGNWPGGENCVNALYDIAAESSDVRYSGAFESSNIFGFDLTLYCASNGSGAIEVSQRIPRIYMNLFTDNLYRVSFNEIESRDYILMTSRIPPTESQYYFGVIEAEYGQAFVSEENLQSLSVQSNQAYFNLPAQCRGASEIEFAVWPQSICPQSAFDQMSMSTQMTLPFNLTARSPSSLRPQGLNGQLRVEFDRNLVLRNFEFNAVPCAFDEIEFSCYASLNTEEVSGYLYTLESPYEIEYVIRIFYEIQGYSFQSNQIAERSFRGNSLDEFGEFIEAIENELNDLNQYISFDPLWSIRYFSDIQFDQRGFRSNAGVYNLNLIPGSLGLSQLIEYFYEIEASELNTCPSMTEVTGYRNASQYEYNALGNFLEMNDFPFQIPRDVNPSVPAILSCSGH